MMSMSLSLTAQSTDGDGINSMQDRYAVVHTFHVGDDDIMNQNNSVSVNQFSAKSESSSDSDTWGGTSFVTDGYDEVENDESFGGDEYEDLDTLSLGSHLMVDGWVDSACSWIDYPISLIQGIGFGRETSLLRQSKGRTRSTISQTNAISAIMNTKFSAGEQQSLRFKRKSVYSNGPVNDIASGIGKLALEDAKEKEIKIIRIQPLNATKSTQLHTKREIEKISKDKIMNEDAAQVSSLITHTTKATEERALKNSPHDNEKDHYHLSKNIKDDPPTESSIASATAQSTDSYISNNNRIMRSSRESETSTKKSPNEKVSEENNIIYSNNVSHGDNSEITDLTYVDTNSRRRTNDVTSQSFPDKNRLDSNDKALSNDIEIIDVLNMGDDQDSWIPGSRYDHDRSKNSEQKEYLKIAARNVKRDAILASDCDDLWHQEKKKVTKKKSSHDERSTKARNVNSHATPTEDLWNEEKVKLQTTPDGIFDDPKACEAFLGHRQGRLRDVGLEKAKNKRLRSKSHRRKLQNVLRDDGKGDTDNNLESKKLPKSRSAVVRNYPPSPEDLLTKQRRCKSRERRDSGKPIPSRKETEHRNASSAARSRIEDLVIVRSIKEGQRIRSSKLDPYETVEKPVVETSTGKSSDEGSSRRRRQRRHILDRHSGSSRQKTNSCEERDDHESMPTLLSLVAQSSDSNISDYDNEISAAKELRKLEKRIEQQLRQAKRETNKRDVWDSETVQSKEIKRIEKKVAKKLHAATSDNPDSENVSSREIRRLEKQLARKLGGESEKRASKLRRIKRKVSRSTLEPNETKPSHFSLSRKQRQLHNDIISIGDSSSEFLDSSSNLHFESLSFKNRHNHNERQTPENSRGMRSRSLHHLKREGVDKYVHRR